MTQKDDFFDGLSKVASDALSSVSGAKEDVSNFMKSKIEAVLNDLDVVQREEFDALKAMVIAQTEEIKNLKAQLSDKA
ncbi:MAG: accessory factor UbiK family protein [Alphaproteobacteria bacterium]